MMEGIDLTPLPKHEHYEMFITGSYVYLVNNLIHFFRFLESTWLNQTLAALKAFTGEGKSCFPVKGTSFSPLSHPLYSHHFTLGSVSKIEPRIKLLIKIPAASSNFFPDWMKECFLKRLILWYIPVCQLHPSISRHAQLWKILGGKRYLKHPDNSFLFSPSLNSSNQYFKNNPEIPSSLWPVLGICYCQCVVSLHTCSFSDFLSCWNALFLHGWRKWQGAVGL